MNWIVAIRKFTVDISNPFRFNTNTELCVNNVLFLKEHLRLRFIVRQLSWRKNFLTLNGLLYFKMHKFVKEVEVILETVTSREVKP